MLVGADDDIHRHVWVWGDRLQRLVYNSYTVVPSDPAVKGLALYKMKECSSPRLFRNQQCFPDIKDNAIQFKKEDFDVKIELPFDDSPSGCRDAGSGSKLLGAEPPANSRTNRQNVRCRFVWEC